MADLNKSTEVNQGNIESGLVNSGNTTKEELVAGLLEKKLECPYPNHDGYAKVRDTLSPEEQKEMKENIRITHDGKIEIIKMKKKFSMLTAQHNGKNIFDGSHVDQYGNTGIKGITYLTGPAARKESKNKGKKILKDITEVQQFINCFPGERNREKMFNFVKLFGLEKTGVWFPSEKKWYNVESRGSIALSKVDEYGGVCELAWNDDYAGLLPHDQKFPTPFIAFEDLD